MSALNAGELSFLRDMIRDTTAVVLGEDKDYLIENRLAEVVRDEGLPSVRALVSELRIHKTEKLVQRVVDAITTHETYFYRDPRVWATLKSHVLPELISRLQPVRRLSIWSAACSSGQEPYSLSMMLRTGFPELKFWQVEHLATDIAAATLARARQGQYTQLEVNRGLPARHLVEFFQKNGQGWQLSSDIRQMIQFREMNLAGDWSFVPELDLVLLRNVLIYFDPAVKGGILTRLHTRMRRGGILMLGSTESAQGLEDFFEPIRREQSLFYQVKK